MISLVDYIKEQLMLEHGGVVPTLHNLAKEISKQLENEIKKSDNGSFIYHYTDAKENELGAFGKNVDINIDFNINRNEDQADIGATYNQRSLKLTDNIINFTLTINVIKEMQHNKLCTKLVHELTHAVTNINDIHNFIIKAFDNKHADMHIDLGKIDHGMNKIQTGSYRLFSFLSADKENNKYKTAVYVYYFLNCYEQNAYIGEMEDILKNYIKKYNVSVDNIRNIKFKNLIDTDDFQRYFELRNRFYDKRKLSQLIFNTRDLLWYKRAEAADKAPKELTGKDLYKYAIEHASEVNEEQLKKKLNTLFTKFDKKLRTSFTKTLFKIFSEEHEKNN